jgi:hypothetical protein
MTVFVNKKDIDVGNGFRERGNGLKNIPWERILGTWEWDVSARNYSGNVFGNEKVKLLKLQVEFVPGPFPDYIASQRYSNNITTLSVPGQNPFPELSY